MLYKEFIYIYWFFYEKCELFFKVKWYKVILKMKYYVGWNISVYFKYLFGGG